MSPTEAGLNVLPHAVGVMIGAQVVTPVLYSRFGPRRVIFGGLMVVISSVVGLSFVDAETNFWWVRLAMFAMGLAMPASFQSAQAAAFTEISSSATGRASTLYNSQRQVMGAAGIALVTTVVIAVGGDDGGPAGLISPDASAYQAAFLVTAGLAALAALSALTIRDSDAVATMRPRPRRSAPADAAPTSAAPADSTPRARPPRRRGSSDRRGGHHCRARPGSPRRAPAAPREDPKGVPCINADPVDGQPSVPKEGFGRSRGRLTARSTCRVTGGASHCRSPGRGPVTHRIRSTRRFNMDEAGLNLR